MSKFVHFNFHQTFFTTHHITTSVFLVTTNVLDYGKLLEFGVNIIDQYI